MRETGIKLPFAAVAIAALALAGVAFATTAPEVFYEPPKLLFKDLHQDASDEDADIVKAGSKYELTSIPVGPFTSSPQCDPIAGGVECPVAGIERIIVNLGDLDDQVQINLGSKARDVRQVLRGQSGGDILLGEKGQQIIKGGDGADTLQGGAGQDILNGGPGPDTCSGGPGDDTIINCEA